MTLAGHARQTLIKGIHTPITWTFTNSTNRTNFVPASGIPDGSVFALTADDVYKLGLQTDDNSVWMLTNHSPVTWVAFGGGVAPEDSRYVCVSANRGAYFVTNTYLRWNQNVPMNLAGFVLPFDTNLFAMSAVCETSSSWTAEVHKNGGGLVSSATLSVSTARTAYRTDLDIDFSAGDEVQLYLNGTNIFNPGIKAFFRRR